MHTHIVDTHVPEPTIYNPEGNPGLFARVLKSRSDRFFGTYVPKVFERGGLVVDIGGGLRIDLKRGNAFSAKNFAVCGPYLQQQNMQFKITDYTDKYAPDLVEDIHALSLADNSVDGLFCLAVLEHVYDPKKAAEEIVRVLKKGGRAFVYVPFLYRYHAHTTDYKDYFRYTKDGIAYLFRDCKKVVLCPVGGIFESMIKMVPLGRSDFMKCCARMIDESTARLRRLSDVQTSGYHFYIEK